MKTAYAAHATWRVLLLVAAMLAAAGVGAAGFAATVPVEPRQVGPHTWYVQGLPGTASAENQGFMSNAGFVVTDEGVVVFDALGTPPLAEALAAAIRRITHRPIRRVIVSHYHADHVYGLQVFKALGAEIWAHRHGQRYLQSDVAPRRLEQRRADLFPWVDENTKLVPADLWLEGDTDFELGGVRFELRHVGPAHSAEDLAMNVPAEGVLFCGDLIFRGRVPYVGDADSGLWLKSLDKLSAMKPETMVPGHGPVSEHPLEDLALTRDYLAYLRAEMGRAVADFVPFEQAYAETDWKRFAHLPAFEDANRANAYNTYLLLESEALRGR